MVPILPPSERRTGVPSTRSLAIKLWDWRVDVSVCMAASLAHSTSASASEEARWPAFVKRTLSRPALFRRSEQRRHHAHLKRPKENRAVHKTHRKRHRRLALELGALAERRDETGSRALARDPSEPGHQSIERVERCTDLPFRHDAFDVEHLEDLFDADDGHFKIAVETAARGELEDAGPHRDHILLRQARLGDLDLCVARLPFSEPRRPGLGRDVVHTAHYGDDVGVDRLGRQWMEFVRDGGFEL